MPELAGLDRSFAATALRFELNVDAIRDFVESLQTAATLPRSEGLVSFTEHIAELLRASSRPETDAQEVTPEIASERLQSVADNIHVTFMHGVERDRLDPEQYVVEGNIAFHRDAGQRLSDRREIEMLVLVPDEMESRLEIAARKLAQGADRARLLYVSALIALVTMFETLVSELVDKFYELNNSALAAGGNTVDVKEVLHADSLEELVRDLIARRTDQVVRGGFDEWSKFFDREYHINLVELLGASRWEVLEAIQRRHVLVHNNGFVDRAYLQRADQIHLDRLPDKPAYGKQLSVDRDYLERVLDSLLVFGFKLVERCWMKLLPSEAIERDKFLVDFMGRYSALARWRVTEAVSSHLLSRKTATDSAKLDAMVHGWLAKKRTGRWAEIREEVECFDAAAFHPTYAVAVHSIREDAESFFRDLPGAVTCTAGLTKPALLYSNLFDEMRARPEFPKEVDALFQQGPRVPAASEKSVLPR